MRMGIQVGRTWIGSGAMALMLAGTAAADNWNTSVANKIWTGTTTAVGLGFADVSLLPVGSDKLISLGPVLITNGTGYVRFLGEADGAGVQYGKIANTSGSALRFFDSFNNTERMRIAANGNVGIGTPNPMGALHVKGDTRIHGRFYVSDAANINEVNLGVDESGIKLITGGFQLQPVRDESDLSASIYSNGFAGVLELKDRNSLGVKLTATGSSFFNGGPVGIGTSTPTAALDVSGTKSQANGIKMTNGYLEFKGNGQISPTSWDADRMRMGFDQDGAFKMMHMSFPRISITSTGKVGLGISQPTHMLEVQQSFGIRRHWDESEIPVRLFCEGTVGTMMLDGSNSGVKISGSGDSYLNGGNFGIGTATPSKKLDVAGDARIAGVLSVNSVRTTEWNIATPDYVFEPGYKLPSLESVDRHVKAKKHLPDIPSAAELEKDGIDLTEMNLKLLKKVEELTLYAIRQDRDIQSLKKTVNALSHHK